MKNLLILSVLSFVFTFVSFSVEASELYTDESQVPKATEGDEEYFNQIYGDAVSLAVRVLNGDEYSEVAKKEAKNFIDKTNMIGLLIENQLIDDPKYVTNLLVTNALAQMEELSREYYEKYSKTGLKAI